MPLRGSILVIPRYGVWFHHLGEDLTTWGAPSGAREVFDRAAVTGSLLAIMRAPLSSSTVIYRSFAATETHSVTRNRNGYHWKTAAFAARKLQDVYDRGDAAVLGVAYSPRLRVQRSGVPVNREMVTTAARMGIRLALGRIERVSTVPEWFVGFSFARDQSRKPWELGGSPIRQMIPPPDRYWADPFPVRDGADYYIFLEEYLRARGAGHIAVTRLGRDGSWTTPERVLERPYHLSYPQVFAWRGAHYLIPETRQARTIEVYCAKHFPGGWERVSVAMDSICAVDATIAEIGGVWWLFASVADDGGSTADELHLFYATEPLGPWRPHRRNPIQSDVRSARPAGNIFSWKGAQYRPAQDSSARYGHSIVLNRITRLDLNGLR